MLILPMIIPVSVYFIVILANNLNPNLSLYSEVVLFVSFFDSNMLSFLVAVTGVYCITTKNLAYMNTLYIRPVVLVLAFILLTNSPANNKITTTLRVLLDSQRLFFVNALDGPSMLHGVSFLATSSLVFIVFTTLQTKGSLFFMKLKNTNTILLSFGIFTFLSGAFWAFFSAVWGNWYNNDPVEVFYILIFLTIVSYTHVVHVRRLQNIFIIFYCLCFLFFLRWGFLNSKHSNNSIASLLSVDFQGVFYFFLYTCFLPLTLLYAFFTKTTTRLAKLPKLVTTTINNSFLFFFLYTTVQSLSIIIPVLYFLDNHLLAGVRVQKTYPVLFTLSLLSYIYFKLIKVTKHRMSTRWPHRVTTFFIFGAFCFSWFFFMIMPPTGVQQTTSATLFYKSSYQLVSVASECFCSSITKTIKSMQSELLNTSKTRKHEAVELYEGFQQTHDKKQVKTGKLALTTSSWKVLDCFVDFFLIEKKYTQCNLLNPSQMSLDSVFTIFYIYISVLLLFIFLA